MPLRDALPVIDDRRYDDIVAEIRARIPGYTPEWRPQWNDLNDSDPGMILAQTVAWMSEMLLYRMARVPDLHYVKFLELIGVELLPAQAARVEVAFAMAEDYHAPTTIVPARTQVAAASDDGPPIVFETERPLTAVACRLQCVQSYDGAVYNDMSARNSVPLPEAGFFPFGEAPRDDAALVLGLGFPAAYPTPDRFPPLSLDLAFRVPDDAAQRRVQQCGAMRGHASASLQWEAWDGQYWQPVDALNDETLAFTRSGHVVVRVPETLSLQRTYLGEYDGTDPVTKQPRDPLFWIRARLVRTQYERAPRLAAVRTNTVPALQAQTVHREILGGTTGARNQVFQTEHTPILPGSLVIEIDEGIGESPTRTAVRWEVVDDLLGAGATSRQVAVNWTSGEVRCGDGEHGQVPVANANDPDTNVVAVEYRYGGGVRGNVAAGAIDQLLASLDGIDDGKVANLFAATGGSDEERLEAAKVRARQTLRARERAVTGEDFELLARQAGNVRRAKALPLAHPRFPGVAVPGAITVIIVPDADARTPAPMPSDGLLRTVCEFLDARRLLTTELYVIAPRYVQVEVRTQVVVRDDADALRVRNDIERALRTYLHPLDGGDAGTGWPFGGAVRFSRVVQQVFSVAGVDSVPRLVIALDGEAQPECRDVPIASNALVYSTTHRIDVVSAREVEEQA